MMSFLRHDGNEGSLLTVTAPRECFRALKSREFLATSALLGALLLYQVWVNITSRAFPALPYEFGQDGMRFLRYAASFAAGLLVALLGEKTAARRHLLDWPIVGIACAVNLIALAVATQGTAPQGVSLTTACIALAAAGFSDAYINCRLTVAGAAHLSPRFQIIGAIVLGVSFVGGRILPAVEWTGAALAASNLIPTACILLTRLVESRCTPLVGQTSRPHHDSDGPVLKPAALPIPPGLSFLLLPIVIAVVVTSTRAHSIGGLWGSSASLPNLQIMPEFILAALVSCIFTYGLLYVSVKRRLYLCVAPSYLIVLFALSLLPAGPEATPWNLGLSCFLEVSNISIYSHSLYYCVNHWGESPMRFVGIQMMALRLFSSVQIVFFESNPLARHVAAFLALVCLAAFIAFSLIKSASETARATANIERPDSSFELSELVGTYGLTNRETQIYLLLAEGRNVPYLQEKLCISEGTARTHVTHIYRKLGINNRQELIELHCRLQREGSR